MAPTLCVFAMLVVGCATSVEVTIVGADPDASAVDGGSAESGATPADGGGVEPGSDPLEPTPTAPSPSPTPVPELPYDEAIDVYFDDVERFWAAAMSPVLGVDFTPVTDQIPYDPADETSVPACAGDVGPSDLYEDNAFYCEPDDYIAWDDVGLFPSLYSSFGDFTVGLVVAHEYAHAVQARAGLDGPTVFVELQADCFAGAWAGDVAAGGTIPFERSDLDDAIGGFLTFSDPLGTPEVDPGAHGTAFDRLNAIAEGFELGAVTCASYLDAPPQTATILIDRGDADEGNFPLDGLLPLLTSDLRVFLETLGRAEISASFESPGEPVEFGAGRGDPPPCGGRQLAAGDIVGSAYYCESDRSVYIDRAELEELWSDIGDFAPAYGVAHSYAMAVVVERVQGNPAAAVLAADCLVGVWARDVFDEARAAPLEPTHEIVLSAGDLDEGIVGLLLVPPLGPSLTEPVGVVTFDRVAAFGQGFFRGVSQCELVS